MNEKIKELAEQAALNAVTKNFNGTSVEVQVPSENWAKEFAELIVKEAMLVCQTEWVSDSSAQKYGNQCADSIKQYFGVEE
jgi:hypothetical protein